MQRSVEPIVRFYLGPVPPTKRNIEKLNGIERKMVRLLIGLRPYPEEHPRTFASRSSRVAASTIEDLGRWWALEWVRSGRKWLEHLERDFAVQKSVFAGDLSVANAKSQFSWAPTLLHFHDATWLHLKRQFSSSGSRTQTRVAGLGRVQARWDESIISTYNLYRVHTSLGSCADARPCCMCIAFAWVDTNHPYIT